MTGSLPKLIYWKKKQIIPSHAITENMSQSQMLRAIKRILSPKCLHTIYNYIFPLGGNQSRTASIFLLFFSLIFVFTAESIESGGDSSELLIGVPVLAVSHLFLCLNGTEILKPTLITSARALIPLVFVHIK